MLGRVHSDVIAFHNEMKNEVLHLFIMFNNTMLCPLPHGLYEKSKIIHDDKDVLFL